MTELRRALIPPRGELLDLLGGHLGAIVPGWQPLAKDILGADLAIDLLGSDPSGRTVLVQVGGAGEDLELIGRALAQRAWVTPRVRDWLQLAPGLPLRPEAGVLAVLLCPAFRPEAAAAAHSLGPASLILATYRVFRDGSRFEPLLEPVGAAAAIEQPLHAASHVAPAPFRTGLTDEDLDLTSDEHAEFE
jgi:hypothetical protein